MKPVRFRFAPSPTGVPHIGNLHTALFSWLLARSMKGNGQFVLRIDDTDSQRNVPDGETLIIEALEWLGLDWDEGPDVGGPFGPYRQSERTDMYRQTIEHLLTADAAYVDAAVGSPAAIRLRLPVDGETVWHDALRGEIRVANGQLADPVIVRGDGSPLYHLATVCDDHHMGITHVVRGDDWISSTPIHLTIYRALGWPEPVWVHVPLIHNQQGQKLKKRDADGGYLISDFIEQGYLSGALFNYLLLLGWAPDGDEEVLSPTAARRQIRIERLSTSAAVFDWEKLNWLNRQYMKRLAAEDIAARMRPYLEEYYGPMPADPRWLTRLAAAIRLELDRFSDAGEVAAWAFADGYDINEEAAAALDAESSRIVLVHLVAELAHVVVLDGDTAARIIAGLRTRLKAEFGLSGRQVLLPIRAALSGRVGGPPLPEMMAIIGKGVCLQRIADVLRS